eukprot:1391466-Amorphochlora_amoeboformis.AAC.1
MAEGAQAGRKAVTRAAGVEPSLPFDKSQGVTSPLVYILSVTKGDICIQSVTSRLRQDFR